MNVRDLREAVAALGPELDFLTVHVVVAYDNEIGDHEVGGVLERVVTHGGMAVTLETGT